MHQYRVVGHRWSTNVFDWLVIDIRSSIATDRRRLTIFHGSSVVGDRSSSSIDRSSTIDYWPTMIPDEHPPPMIDRRRRQIDRRTPAIGHRISSIIDPRYRSSTINTRSQSSLGGSFVIGHDHRSPTITDHPSSIADHISLSHVTEHRCRSITACRTIIGHQPPIITITVYRTHASIIRH